MADQGHALSVERRIEAPIEQVWRAMTERFGEWFCPKPWRAETRELDWRPGGRCCLMMYGPDGEAVPNEGTIVAFEPDRRFVFTDAFTGDWRPAGPFMVGSFEIEPDGAGTLYRATARHWTQEAMERHREMGFEAGWGAAAGLLKALAEER